MPRSGAWDVVCRREIKMRATGRQEGDAVVLLSGGVGVEADVKVGLVGSVADGAEDIVRCEQRLLWLDKATH